MTESDTDQNHQMVLGRPTNDSNDASSLVPGEMGSIVPRRNHPYRRRSADSNALSSVYEDAQSVHSNDHEMNQLVSLTTRQSNQMEICDVKKDKK